LSADGGEDTPDTKTGLSTGTYWSLRGEVIFIDGKFVAGDDVDITAYETPLTYPEAKRSTVITAIKIGTSNRQLKLFILTKLFILIASSCI
jgi:hypothetical protein